MARLPASTRRIVAIAAIAAFILVNWSTTSFTRCCGGVERTNRVHAQAAEQVESLAKLPIGACSFEAVRETNCIYVDKTRFLPKLLSDSYTQHVFVRPKGFGKTLLLDTMKCVFMQKGAKKDALFQGLDITKTKEGKELLTQELPVVLLKMNECVATEGRERLKQDINSLIIKEAERNGVHGVQPSQYSLRSTLSDVVEAIHKKHDNKRVVFLVDDYEAPITMVVDALANVDKTDKRVRETRFVLQELYEEVEWLTGTGELYCAMYAGELRLIFTTFFSAGWFAYDISNDPFLATACGFTETELRASFLPHLRPLLDRDEQTVDDLKEECGEYRFSFGNESVLWPWATLNRLAGVSDKQVVKDAQDHMSPKWLQKLLLIPGVRRDIEKSLQKWHCADDLSWLKVDGLEELSERDWLPYQEKLTLLLQTGCLVVTETMLIEDKNFKNFHSTHARLSALNRVMRESFWKTNPESFWRRAFGQAVRLFGDQS